MSPESAVHTGALRQALEAERAAVAEAQRKAARFEQELLELRRAIAFEADQWEKEFSHIALAPEIRASWDRRLRRLRIATTGRVATAYERVDKRTLDSALTNTIAAVNSGEITLDAYDE